MTPIEKAILAAIDGNRDRIIEFGRDINTHAELGYKEFRTAKKFATFAKDLGLRVEEGHAITGVKAYLGEGATGPTLALIGELDALRIPAHPKVNPETQAAHACGHHAQLAGVVGAAIALSLPEVAKALGAPVVFFAVPAEEYGEIEFKNRLRDEGKIKYGGGKCELIRIGAFDDVALALVHHSGEKASTGNGTSNGFVSKVIRIKGREAHAAAAPEKGVNAVNAASIGLTALAYHRETFKDEDSVRIHPIITKGGNLVNVVPEEVVLETLVRAKTIDAILDADRKTDRAFKAGADALGAGYEIETMPGYLPRIPQEPHAALVGALKSVFPGKDFSSVPADKHGAGSTDVGDLQQVIPVLGFSTGGVKGNFHSSQFEVVDEEEAYVATAKVFALAAYALLKDGAAEAKKVVEGYKAPYTKQGYIEFMDSLIKRETREVRA
jgi:amidohydrolase